MKQYGGRRTFGSIFIGFSLRSPACMQKWKTGCIASRVVGHQCASKKALKILQAILILLYISAA